MFSRTVNKIESESKQQYQSMFVVLAGSFHHNVVCAHQRESFHQNETSSRNGCCGLGIETDHKETVVHTSQEDAQLSSPSRRRYIGISKVKVGALTLLLHSYY